MAKLVNTKSNKNILIVTAHADDLEIGMGGTVSYLKEKGFNIISIIGFINEAHRIDEAYDAQKVLDIDDIQFGIHSSTGKERDDVCGLDQYIEKYKPHSVFTQWHGDSHVEHKKAYDLTLQASRKNKFNLYTFEPVIPGGITEAAFRPQMFVDISDHIDKKMEALKAHKSQMKKYGKDLPEAIKARARFRGYQCNAEYAECFEIIKQVNTF